MLENAIKYSSPDSLIEVLVSSKNDLMHIDVCDRGVGIPPEDLERIFDKFYRVQHPGSIGGTGLGLAICKGIVEAHSGSILAKNRPGGGTIITILIPEELSR